jgi:repressor LexA
VSRGLTDRQREVLAVIRAYAAVHGYPPSNRDIGRALGISSTNGVRDHLRALERKGAIRVDPWIARGIVIIDQEAA